MILDNRVKIRSHYEKNPTQENYSIFYSFNKTIRPISNSISNCTFIKHKFRLFNNKIFMLAARLAHLNPYLEPAKLTACIQRINLNWCKPPLPFTEVKTICKWVSEKDAAGELRITPESKKIWIDRTVHRSTKEAQSVSAKTVGAIRRKKRIEMLKKLLPELAVALGRKPTKQELADRAGIHFNTVKKYLKEIGWTKFDHVGRAS